MLPAGLISCFSYGARLLFFNYLKGNWSGAVHPAGIVTIGCPFAGPASVNEKMIIRNEKICFDR
jgi:hypothetical protein